MTKGFCVALIFVSGLFVSRSARANTIGDPNAVIAAGGTLGIGTSTPHSTITIIGDIAAQSGYWVGDAYSAYGTIYGAPWYGLGRSTLKVYPQTVYPTVQLAGYYGLNLITAGGILVIVAVHMMTD